METSLVITFMYMQNGEILSLTLFQFHFGSRVLFSHYWETIQLQCLSPTLRDAASAIWPLLHIVK